MDEHEKGRGCWYHCLATRIPVQLGALPFFIISRFWLSFYLAMGDRNLLAFIWVGTAFVDRGGLFNRSL
ncbi:hypothetical protein B0H12DRAFT_1099612 [Mycena haematopus]|nr:hypothetical protein B0H12DRAFT_1099612 [Mycena haematopus]